MGDSIKLIGEGMRSGKVHQPILTAEQIAELKISPETEPFDGDAAKFRLGIEAIRLGLAYEYDPYFSLSIAIQTNKKTSENVSHLSKEQIITSMCM